MNIPNLLSFARICLTIATIILLLQFKNMQDYNMLALAASLFAIASITDFLDGYLARKNGWETDIGAFIDPVADKFLVIGTMVTFIYVDIVYSWLFLPTLIIIMRELYVSALREYTAPRAISIPVSNLAKWKTATQLLSMIFLFLNSYIASNVIYICCLVILYSAAFLTVITAVRYSKNVIYKLS